MHKAISTKVQGKTRQNKFWDKNSTMSIKLFDFLIFMCFLDFWHKKKKIDQKQKQNQKYPQIDNQTTININNKLSIKYRHKA